MRLCAAAALLALLAAPPAAAFCVVNNTQQPVDVKAGGGAMPVFYSPRLAPGQRICHVPRRTDIGIMVEIEHSGSHAGQLKCRLSVPADKAEISVGSECRVRIE